MLDVSLDWNDDLIAGSSGDIALVDGSAQTSQRLLRRLLTNAGDYIWNLDYGGGLGSFVGGTTSPTEIEAVVRTQIALEAAIPSTPAATIDIQTLDTLRGCVVADITYADPISGDLVALHVLAG